VPGRHQIPADILTGPHQIPGGFLLDAGHRDRNDLTCWPPLSVQTTAPFRMLMSGA
jgi:hypothetical protein